MAELTTLIVGSSHGECNALLAFFSRADGFHVLKPAHTIEDALAALRTGCVDVLILDTVWPDAEQDAFDLIRAIDGALSKPPMLFLISGIYDDELLCRFQSLGALYCFVKPYEPAEVLRRVRQTVNIPSYMAPQDYYNTYYGGPTSEEFIQKEITNHIRAVGLPAHLKGYHFIRHAVWILVRAEMPMAVSITKTIYPLVAEEFHTKPALVERSIRNAIEVAWVRGDTDRLYEYFGYTVDDKKGKPTNAEFIAMIADRVRMAMPVPAYR